MSEMQTGAYDNVIAARSRSRATASDYIGSLFTDFTELHGDRLYGDDRAVICGIAMFGADPVTVIGIERGHDTKDRIARNFGSANPEGYRKALRQMKAAEKFGRPIVCFVDTSGAFCGIGAEERGQGQAIAENLAEMSALRVPILSILIGEGGSGGALALAVADEVWMLERAVYSVISPEGCASILWKDPKRVKEASECLRLTAEDLLRLGAIDRIIPEGDAESGDFTQVYQTLRSMINEKLYIDSKTPIDMILDKRYERFRRIGSDFQ